MNRIAEKSRNQALFTREFLLLGVIALMGSLLLSQSQSESESDGLTALVACGLAMALPLFAVSLEQRVSSKRWRTGLQGIVVLTSCGIAFSLLSRHSAMGSLFALNLIQWTGVWNHRQLFWAHGVWVCGLISWWASWFAQGVPWVLMIAVVHVTLSVFALSWLHSLQAQQSLSQRSRIVFGHSWNPVSKSRSRILFDVSRSTLTLATVLILLYALRQSVVLTQGQNTAEPESSASDSASEPPASPGNSSFGATSLERGLGDDADSSSNERLFLIKIDKITLTHFNPGDPFLFRASTLERLADGIPRSRPEDDDVRVISVPERQWFELEASASQDDLIALDITSAPIRDSQTSRTLIVAGPKPTALYLDSKIESGKLYRHADGTLSLADQVSFPLRYGVVYAGKDWRHVAPFTRSSDRRIRSRATRSNNPRHLELPRDWKGLEDQRKRAKELTANATSDIERVQLIVSDLQSQYAYSLEVPFPGDVSSIDILEQEKSGCCTHFALAALVRLRSLGIPCRIAIGYLVDAWDPDRGRYEVLGSDTHAWIEVPFQGIGWVSFDPTSNRDLDAGEEDPAEEVIESQPQMAWGWDWVFPILAVALLLITWLTSLTHRLSPAQTRSHDRSPQTFRGLEALFSELERHGYKRPPGQTPGEFLAFQRPSYPSDSSGSPASISSHRWEEIEAWVLRLYPSRFGARPWSPEDDEAFQAFLHELGQSRP